MAVIAAAVAAPAQTAWSERAEPYDYGEPEAVALELYLIVRARGMPIETPGARP